MIWVRCNYACPLTAGPESVHIHVPKMVLIMFLKFCWVVYYGINPNSLDNKGSWRILKDFYCSVTMLRELGLRVHVCPKPHKCNVSNHRIANVTTVYYCSTLMYIVYVYGWTYIGWKHACTLGENPAKLTDVNPNVNHAHFTRATCTCSSNDHQKPIGNALTTHWLAFNVL